MSIGSQRVDWKVVHEPFPVGVLERLGEPLGQLREVDRRREVPGRPFLQGPEAQERPERDESALAGDEAVRTPARRRRGALAADPSLVGADQVTVQASCRGYAGALGEPLEAAEVGPCQFVVPFLSDHCPVVLRAITAAYRR